MGKRDDRVLPSMRWVALVVVLVLLPALVILWGMPARRQICGRGRSCPI